MLLHLRKKYEEGRGNPSGRIYHSRHSELVPPYIIKTNQLNLEIQQLILVKTPTNIKNHAPQLLQTIDTIKCLPPSLLHPKPPPPPHNQLNRLRTKYESARY